MGENGRLNTGYVRTVLTKRGLRVDDDEKLRRLLSSLDVGFNGNLSDALRRVIAGVETQGDGHLVDGLVFAISKATAEVMCSAGYMRISEAELLAWYQAGGSLPLARAAAAGDEDAKRQLAGRFGAPESSMADRSAQLTGATEADLPKQTSMGARRVRGTRKGTWTSDDRAKSFARDLDAVKSLPASKHRVFAKKAALTFEIDLLRTPEYNRAYTVRIEGAERAREEEGYDWSKKIVFQLDARELHLAAVVVLGWRDEFIARNHGEARDKSLEIKRQAGGISVNLRMTGRSLTVPLDEEALYKVALLFIRALHLNDWDMDRSTLLETLRLTAAFPGA
ncbi:MAG: hypothetical protein E6R08_01045 [Nevskiaceae bacterium]|nr:MAG: hypothetical protein E6R08_01045 [Nevskiaceae bacterium]